MKLSIILPVYNGQSILPKIIGEVKFFSEKNPSFEFIFVDDGSSDDSQKILLKLLNGKNNFKIVSYKKNRGKGHAVKKGFENSSGEFICFIDSDLAYSLDYLYPLIKLLQKSDLVIGSRSLYRKENSKRIYLKRRIPGIVFNFLSRIILNHCFYDTQAGIKGFKREAAKKLFFKQNIEGFAFDMELIYRAKINKLKISELPVIVSNPETYNSSKVKIMRDSLKMLKDIIKIRFLVK